MLRAEFLGRVIEQEMWVVPGYGFRKPKYYRKCFTEMFVLRMSKLLNRLSFFAFTEIIFIERSQFRVHIMLILLNFERCAQVYWLMHNVHLYCSRKLGYENFINTSLAYVWS